MKKMKIPFLFPLLLILNNSKAQDQKIEVISSTTSFETLSVDVNIAEQLIANYREKRYKRARRFPLFGAKYDARSCWFDVQKFSKYISNLNSYLKYKEDSVNKEISGASQKITIPPVSGFRLYYITYGKDDTEAPGEIRQRDHTLNKGKTKKVHSIMIVPTQKFDNVDIDIIEDRPNSRKRVAIFMLETEIQNQGTLCPPLPPSSCRGTTLMMLADENHK